MKITRSQLKQIIKEELGRTDWRSELSKIVNKDLYDIWVLTAPDYEKSGEQIDKSEDFTMEHISLIHQTVDDVRNTIDEYITQMMREG